MARFTTTSPGQVALNESALPRLEGLRLKLIEDDETNQTLFEGSPEDLEKGAEVKGDCFAWLSAQIEGESIEFERLWIPKRPEELSVPVEFSDDLKRAISEVIE